MRCWREDMVSFLVPEKSGLRNKPRLPAVSSGCETPACKYQGRSSPASVTLTFVFEQQGAEPARLLGFARNHTSKLTRRVAISCTPLRFLMLRYFACHRPQSQLLKLRIFRVPLAPPVNRRD
jgi:hypothetical protein